MGSCGRPRLNAGSGSIRAKGAHRASCAVSALRVTIPNANYHKLPVLKESCPTQKRDFEGEAAPQTRASNHTGAKMADLHPGDLLGSQMDPA